ncbi:hypothetical protein STEG23_014039, partial [Scotinomys teguina]
MQDSDLLAAGQSLDRNDLLQACHLHLFSTFIKRVSCPRDVVDLQEDGDSECQQLQKESPLEHSHSLSSPQSPK